jgi:hypothetical protein
MLHSPGAVPAVSRTIGEQAAHSRITSNSSKSYGAGNAYSNRIHLKRRVLCDKTQRELSNWQN